MDSTPSPESVEPDISVGRATLVNLLIATILLLSAYAIIWQVEAYPFSHFPMYSSSRAGITTYERIAYVGITESGEEFPLTLREMKVITGTRPKYLDRYARRIRNQPARVNALLERLTSLAASQPVIDEKAIPAFTGFLVYSETFNFDRWASNRSRPEKREILLETRTPSKTEAKRR